MVDPMHFDARTEVYERARPPYPGALWQRLRDLGLVRAGVRVIDVGAGTGQATGPLLDAGATVTAVEPGPVLAERLRTRFPQVRVLNATAEEVALPDGAYDLGVAATSVHWLDLDVVVPKLHRALVPGGDLAVWRTAFGDPRVSTPFRERVFAIVARREGAAVRPGPDELDTGGWVHWLTASGHFAETHTEEFRWSIELGADQVRDLFSTFSNWSAAEAEAAADAARELGGRVTEHYVSPLITLKRVDLS